jgi:hypothetical protein
VPTLVESGYPDFVIDAWAGVVAPTGTPPSIIDKLNASINAGLKTPAAQRSLAKFSASPISARRTILKVFSPARRRNGGQSSSLPPPGSIKVYLPHQAVFLVPVGRIRPARLVPETRTGATPLGGHVLYAFKRGINRVAFPLAMAARSSSDRPSRRSSSI